MPALSAANLKRAYLYLKRNGLIGTWYAAREEISSGRKDPYEPERATKEEQSRQRKWAEELPEEKRVFFSLLVPAYLTAREHLHEMLMSVLDQTYPYFELILADASPEEAQSGGPATTRVHASLSELLRMLPESYRAERIHYLPLAENGGISANTNAALQQAKGDYILLLDHDDLLTPDALYAMASAILEAPSEGRPVPGMLYSDEDKCDGQATRFFEPARKTDFDREYLLSNNYICHLLCVKRELAAAALFRPDYDGAQDYDFTLRVSGGLKPEEIRHIPKVLYHWRCHSASTAENPASKAYAYEAGRRASEDYCRAKGWNTKVVMLPHVGFYLPCFGDCEDLFSLRPELGAIGGRVLSGTRFGRTIGGAMAADGRLCYEGLPAKYSGYFHRAVLSQSAAALDLRCFRLNPAYAALFEEITQVPYRECEVTLRAPVTGRISGPGRGKPQSLRLFDVTALPAGCDRRALEQKLGGALRAKGLTLLYYPEWGRVWKR